MRAWTALRSAVGSEKPRVPRTGRGWAWGLVVVIAALCPTPSQAFAASGYVLGGRIGTLAADPATFSSPAGVAVQQSTQDVFVVDTGNGRVVQLDSSGAFVSS